VADLKKNDQIDPPVTMGLAIFIVVFIVVALTSFIVAPQLRGYPWGRAVQIGADILLIVLVVSSSTMEFIQFIKRRRQERRERAERDAGLM